MFLFNCSSFIISKKIVSFLFLFLILQGIGNLFIFPSALAKDLRVNNLQNTDLQRNDLQNKDPKSKELQNKDLKNFETENSDNKVREEDPKVIVKKLIAQKRKKSVVLNYHHFYESYQALKAGSYYEDDAMMYGAGISYDDNWYVGVLGWGYNLEIVQGVAVAGTAGNSRYYQTRVPYQMLRLGGRFFRRLNAFFEMGPSVVIQYKNMSWPVDSGYQVQAPQNPTLGLYLEVRSRLNLQYDFIQKIGILGKSKVAAWSLGFSYNF